MGTGDFQRPGDELSAAQARIEWLKCSRSPAYFIHQYCFIYNATEREWIPFRLWPAQVSTLRTILHSRLLLVLKARQLGLSWLVLCFALWEMLFRPEAAVLLFSRRDEEATELLARLEGIYERLPSWARARSILKGNTHEWQLSNGSSAKAFPTTGGRSYTGSLVIVDEADFVPDLDGLLEAVKPTIDAGGRMIMVTTVDKDQPGSAFKEMYRGARKGLTEWTPIFLPWHARPGRTAEWYERQKADVLARSGSLDSLYQEYPATETEALQPRSLDKRILSAWIEQCYVEVEPLQDPAAPAIPGLTLYRKPVQGRAYVIGLDPAEGNPTSDDSAMTVLDVLSGEEVAVLVGKFQPSVFAGYADVIGRYYNDAALMVERNNHGHAVLLWLEAYSELRRLKGPDDKPGWLSNALGKTLLYNEMADCFRDKATTLHSFETYTQLASIEGATLRAPEGFHDDRADSYALANVGRSATIDQKPQGSSQVVSRQQIQGLLG